MSREKSETLADQTLARLRNDIISGRLAPGTVIRDADLAKRYGVSTSPLREALILLETEQLVWMPSDRVRQVVPISRVKTLEICEVLCVLMEYAIITGVKKMPLADFALMEGYSARLQECIITSDTKSALKASQMFFDVMIRACGNAELRRVLARNAGWIERLFTLVVPIEQSGWFEHSKALMRAIRADDMDGLTNQIKQHHAEFLSLIAGLPLHG